MSVWGRTCVPAVMGLAVALGMVGCSFDSSGVPVESGAGMDGGGPPPEPEPVDTDGDGKLDTEDNCPAVANEAQWDEDGDEVGDACDTCPTVVDEDQADGDGDGVGDACDPRPTEGGDSIVYFDSFHEDSDGAPEGWVVATGMDDSQGAWSVSGGQLHQDDAAAAPTTLFLAGTPVPSDVIIETVATLQTLPDGSAANAPEPHVGVLVRFGDNVNSNNDDGYLCSLGQEPQGAEQMTTVHVTSFLVDDELSKTIATWSLAVSRAYRLVLYQHGANTICQATQVQDHDGLAVKTAPEGSAAGTVALQTRDVSATFDYVIVYGLGGPGAPCMGDDQDPCFCDTSLADVCL